MSGSLVDELKQVLKEAQDKTGIKDFAVVSREGLLIASAMEGQGESEVVAAMAASMFGSASNVVEQLLQSKPSQIIIETPKGRVLALSAGEKAVIISITPSASNLGLVIMELRRTADKVAQLLD